MKLSFGRRKRTKKYMGTNYHLKLKCAYCNKLNDDIYYAPSSSVESFKCEYCSKTNLIVELFRAIKNERKS